ncbi:MAG: mechanosensitive ion channel family protein [Myxococcota bacterium]
MLSDPLDHLADYLQSFGLGPSLAEPIAVAILFALALLAAGIVDFLTNRILLTWVKRFAARSKTQWDNAMVDEKVPDRLAHLAPILVIYAAVPFVFPKQDLLASIVQRLAMVLVIITVAMAINGVLNASLSVYRSYEGSQRAPIKTYVQVAQIVLLVIAVVLIVSRLIDRSPWALLSGIGALTAVIMLVFKDSILGFVASVQLTTNDMVRRGDWIEMPKYGADGDVLDVSLNTVKVQNWDKTISTIPTYQLMQDSFKNWRGMSESGGRRIKRALFIDMNSIRFCDEHMLQRFEQIDLLRDYLHEKKAEVEATNRAREVNDMPTNLRRLTNVGTFRAYVVAYLRHHPKIHKDMTFLVRQLPPSDRGLPIEIYVFSNDQNWSRYEGIQADLFDHFLAVLPEFGLRVFQLPAGSDFVAGAGPSVAGVVSD